MEEELHELLKNEGRKREEERPTCPCTEQGESSHHQTHSPSQVSRDGGYNSTTYTWATGAPGSIFSLATPVVRRPPPVATQYGLDSSYPRTGMSYAQPPHKRNFPSGTQEHFWNDSEEIDGGPEVMGLIPLPLPLDNGDPQIPLVVIGQHNASSEATAQRKRRGCLGSVMKWWKSSVGRD